MDGSDASYITTPATCMFTLNTTVYKRTYYIWPTIDYNNLKTYLK